MEKILEKFFQDTDFLTIGGGSNKIEKIEAISHAHLIGPCYTYWPMYFKEGIGFLRPGDSSWMDAGFANWNEMQKLAVHLRMSHYLMITVVMKFNFLLFC